MAALAAALIDFGIYVYICTDRPKFLYDGLAEENWQYRKCRIDGGVVHQANLKADIPATKKMLLELFSHREELVAEETIWLRKEKIDLVIADIPYFIIEACGYAEVPVFGLSNFDWAFIYNDLFAADPEMKIVINSIYGLYRRLDRSYVPALGSAESVPGFREPEFTGLLARRGNNIALNFDEPVLSIMFGGEGDISIDFEQICPAWAGLVLSTNTHCKAKNHRRVNPEDDFLAIIKSSDLVLCKPGYSTFAEILSCGKPMLFIPRKNYPEERVLIAGVEGYHFAKQIDAMPDGVDEWQALFESMPKVGQRVEEENAAIVGRIMCDFIMLRNPLAKLMSVFDMGSNNLNYCLWDMSAGKLVHRCWISTHLARTIADNKLMFSDLSEDIPALKTLLESDAMIASEKHLIATGILRKADNAETLVQALCEHWQLKGKIISARDEMKYAWYAAADHIPKGAKALVFDIGGSSTELVWRTFNRGFAGLSLNMGLISLADHNHPEQMMHEALCEAADLSFDLLIGVGLTATMLSVLAKQSNTSEILSQARTQVSKAELEKLGNELLHGSVEASNALKQDTLGLYTMMLAADFTVLLLDRYGHSDFMVCNDGISIGYAKWKTR